MNVNFTMHNETGLALAVTPELVLSYRVGSETGRPFGELPMVYSRRHPGDIEDPSKLVKDGEIISRHTGDHTWIGINPTPQLRDILHVFNEFCLMFA